MKRINIDILFIVNDAIYDYTKDEIISISEYYINVVYSKINNYRRIVCSNYFDFQYIFIFANQHFSQLNLELRVLNEIYNEKRVFILCSDNYLKLKG